MWEIVMTGVAFVFGITALLMVWITTYQTKTLNQQLDGINNRLGILRQDWEAQQSATSREVFHLKSKIDELTDRPVMANGNGRTEPAGSLTRPLLQEMRSHQRQPRPEPGDN